MAGQILEHRILLRHFIVLLSVCLFGSAAAAMQILDDIAPKTTKAAPQAPPPPQVDREKQAFDACIGASGTGPCQAYLERYRSGRYTKAVRDIIDGRTDKPAPPPPPQADPELKAWNACISGNASDSIATCEAYLATYRQGKWAGEAERRLAALRAADAEKKASAVEKTLLDQCLSGSAPSLCDAFIARYPTSISVPIAKARITAIAAEDERRAVDQKRRDEQSKADAKAQAAAEQDKTAFAACRDSGNPADCQAYLDTAPGGAFRAQAQARINTLAAANQEKAAWDACRNGTTTEPCLAFGRSFPSSANAGQAATIARERAASADAARAENAAWALCEPGQMASPCSNYVNVYPAGPHAPAAQAIVARIKKDETDKRALEQEQASWAQCETGKTILPCQQYLDTHPTGRFVSAAKTRIEVVSTGETEPQAVAALGLVVKRNAKSQMEVVSVQGNSSAMGYVFGGDIITTINDKPYNPRQEPLAALEAAIAADNGRVEVLIMRGAAPVSKVLRARR